MRSVHSFRRSWNQFQYKSLESANKYISCSSYGPWNFSISPSSHSSFRSHVQLTIALDRITASAPHQLVGDGKSCLLFRKASLRRRHRQRSVCPAIVTSTFRLSFERHQYIRIVELFFESSPAAKTPRTLLFRSSFERHQCVRIVAFCFERSPCGEDATNSRLLRLQTTAYLDGRRN